MPGDFLRHGPRLTMQQFHAFRDERPKEEKWELIDGVPIMMPPPTLVHQWIADSLNQLLNAHLTEVKPEWRAVRDAGVWLKGDEKYNPEPDVVIIDAAIALGQVYARRFYLAAEVLSARDKKPVVAAKLHYYQDHARNRCILLVRQDRVGAEQDIREATRGCGASFERSRQADGPRGRHHRPPRRPLEGHAARPVHAQGGARDSPIASADFYAFCHPPEVSRSCGWKRCL